MITSELNASHVVVLPSITSSHMVNTSFYAYVVPSPSWLNGSYLTVLEESISRKLALNQSVEALFGSAVQHTFASLVLDLNECLSGLGNCNSLAACTNSFPGFQCRCFNGYSGDDVTCTAITCSSRTAPPLPGLATQIAYYPNNTVISNPVGALPFGTTLRYTCLQRYKLRSSSGATSNLVIRCGGSPSYKNTNWSGDDYACIMDLEFKVAIIASAASALIIILVIGLFISQWCIKRERKARKKKAGKDDVMQYENNVFGD
uniref:Sushi domain-containing protein n=1 Tax=Ciona savignyi TaxID=51511 RepID=H2YWV7_CIOSA